MHGYFLVARTTHPVARGRHGDTAGPVRLRIRFRIDHFDQRRLLTASDGTRFRAEVVATDLVVPWSLVFAPDGRAFVTERPGRVRVIVDGQVLAEPALTLPDTYAVWEAGVMGIVLDPEFSSNGHIYLLYTRNRPGGLPPVNTVVRYREVENTLAEAVVLLDEMPADRIHDGGRLRFGPDGYLYVAMGDASEEDDAQDLAPRAGRIIRIDKDGTTPASNPRGSPVYSYGHRNPQGFDWHPESGDMWATEHGNVGNDEVNLIRAGANYGWPNIEGSEEMPGMETPVLFFSPSIAPSGASFYTGNAIPAFRHDLFFAALRGEHLHRVQLDPNDPARVTGNERLNRGSLRAPAGRPDRTRRGALHSHEQPRRPRYAARRGRSDHPAGRGALARPSGRAGAPFGGALGV